MNLNLRQHGKTWVTIAATAVISIGWATQAGAATGTWAGGAGATWDTSSANWSDVTGTPWDLANGVVNTARFNTAAATPSVSGIVYANRLTFDDTATIGGSGTITLGGTNPKLTVNANATISSALAGTVAVTKDGSGTLVLANAISPYSGALTVTNGELNLASGCMLTNVLSILPSAGATVRLTGGIISNKTSGTSFSGSFIQENGTNVYPAIGLSLSGANARYEMQDGYFKITEGAGALFVGNDGTGTVVQTGGTMVFPRNSIALALGGETGKRGQGFYTISGGTLNVTTSGGYIQIGNSTAGSTGTMTIASAASVNANEMRFGSTANAVVGILNLQGGVLRINSVYNNGAQAVHQFNFSGGTLAPYNAIATIGSATAANNTTITLSGTDATISSSDKDGIGRTVNIYSKLTGSGAVTFTGNGTNVLIATNDYTGTTTLSNGTTLARMTVALPGYGTPGKLSVAAGGVLALSYGGASDWVSGEVDSLLSQNGAGFAGGSALGLDTSNGNGVYGNITLANFSLVKLGTNTLTLSGANTYSNTTINGGALRLNSALGSGNLTLNGGVLELQNPSTFTRALGSGAGEVQLANASGFSAYGSAATVNLNNDHSVLVWGSAYFNPGPLILNSTIANAALDFQNPINLNNTGSALTRTVQVAAATATMSYPLSNSSGAASLAKTGAGTLTLTANNTITGSVTVSAGELNLASGCMFTNVQSIIPSATGATVRLTGGIVTNKAAIVTIDNGSFIQESGTNVVTSMKVGNADTSVSALYRMEGGYLKCAVEGPYIGNNSILPPVGPYTFIQTGGTVDMMRSGGTVLQLGGVINRSTPGFYTISGGTINALATTLQIGNVGGGDGSSVHRDNDNRVGCRG